VQTMTAATQYGCPPATASMGPAAVTETMATGTSSGYASGLRSLADPTNPFLWLAGIVAATVGLIAVSGRVRLGPASAAVAVGKG